MQNKKLANIYEFFEEGIYSKEIFIKRSNIISKQIKKIKYNIEKQKQKMRKKKQKEKDTIPKIENLLDIYDILKTPEEKNLLLKTLVEKVEYFKKSKATSKNSDIEDFVLDIYPKTDRLL